MFILTLKQMADGEEDTICDNCSLVIDVYNELKKDTSKYNRQINDYLMAIDDVTGSPDNWDGSIFLGATVPLYVSCSVCRSETVVYAFVSGKTVWDNNQIKHFQDVEVFSVSRNSALLSISLSNCFHRQTFLKGTLQTNKSVPSSESEEVHPEAYHTGDTLISLRIIAKTRMNNGYCYLGFNEATGRILRPILTTETNKCCWPRHFDFQLFESYCFVVIFLPLRLPGSLPCAQHSPDGLDQQPLTPYPHAYEDVLVESPEAEYIDEQFDIEFLVSISKLDVADIFPGMQERKYIYLNDNTSSVGILRCKAEHVMRYVDDFDKNRCNIVVPSGIYDFPFTAIEYDDDIHPNDDVLVVLGLARPYDRDGEYLPPRCYILVVGFFNVK